MRSLHPTVQAAILSRYPKSGVWIQEIMFINLATLSTSRTSSHKMSRMSSGRLIKVEYNATRQQITYFLIEDVSRSMSPERFRSIVHYYAIRSLPMLVTARPNFMMSYGWILEKAKVCGMWIESRVSADFCPSVITSGRESTVAASSTWLSWSWE